MEGQREDFIGGTERVFHSVAMVKVKVNIQDTLILLPQLENGHNNVIEVTEPRRGISARTQDGR
jgi:CTP-dependent riboflavin kinase